MPNYTFKKTERLKRKKLIEQLFKQGQSFGVYPVRIVWIAVVDEQLPHAVQCAVSVSKRKFPKAVQRNRIKRQLREAWRLYKHRLYANLPEGQEYAVMLLYTGKAESSQTIVEQCVQRIIKKLPKKLK